MLKTRMRMTPNKMGRKYLERLALSRARAPRMAHHRHTALPHAPLAYARIIVSLRCTRLFSRRVALLLRARAVKRGIEGTESCFAPLLSARTHRAWRLHASTPLFVAALLRTRSTLSQRRR